MPFKKLLRKHKGTRKSDGLKKSGSPRKSVRRPTYSNKLSYNDLINAESALGRTIFGPVPEGHQREFFAARKNVWIWYENWTDQNGRKRKMTVRYEVRPAGVFKRTNTGKYKKIGGAELNNFRKATHTYLNLIKAKLYS